MRIRGRVMNYSIDILRDFSEMTMLGRLTPVMMPGSPRRIMRLEIEVMDIEGPSSDANFGYCDINIVNATTPAPTPPVRTPTRVTGVDQAVENIRALSRALEAGEYRMDEYGTPVMTATGAELEAIAADVGLTRRMEEETDAELRRRANAALLPQDALRRVQESMATGVVRRGGPSPVEEGPRPKPEPPKPEEPKEPTRWSMLEID